MLQVGVMGCQVMLSPPLTPSVKPQPPTSLNDSLSNNRNPSNTPVRLVETKSQIETGETEKDDSAHEICFVAIGGVTSDHMFIQLTWLPAVCTVQLPRLLHA